MSHKVVIVGSRSFPIDTVVGTQIVELMRAFPEDTLFLTRGSDGFDRFVMQVAPIIGRHCFAYPASGGADNYLRDIELVKDGDEVLAFFDPGTLDDSQSGTAHVVEKALDQGKTVRAYSVVNEALIWVGEND
jgi:hypothetical protein